MNTTGTGLAQTGRTTERKSRDAIHERIQALEQRLEHRRARLREDTAEAKSAVAETTRRWVPVAAAAGAGLAALWLTRRSRNRRIPARAPTYAAAADEAQRRGVRWASLLGLASTAYKLGTSPQARLLINALRRRRARSPS